MLQPNHKTIIITMQNGIGNLEVIKDVIESSDIGKLAQPTIIQAVTDQGAMMLGPGYVKHTGHGIITFARSKDEEVNKQVLSLFQSSGQEVEINENIESVQWGKLVINAGINPVTALYNLENGQLVHNEKGRSMLRKLINEAVAVAIAKGITLSYGTTSEQAIAKAETILRNTSQNKSSMLTDILRGLQLKFIRSRALLLQKEINWAWMFALIDQCLRFWIHFIVLMLILNMKIPSPKKVKKYFFRVRAVANATSNEFFVLI